MKYNNKRKKVKNEETGNLFFFITGANFDATTRLRFSELILIIYVNTEHRIFTYLAVLISNIFF